MKLIHGVKPGRKVIEKLEDCFQETDIAGGEEWRKLWTLYRSETKEQAIIRKVKVDALEHQTKYLICTQSVLYALCLHLCIGDKEVWKSGGHIHAGMGGFGSGKIGGTQMCGALIGARMAIGLALSRQDMYAPGAPSSPGPSDFSAAAPLVFEITKKFEDHFGSSLCYEIQENYFGRHWFMAEDFEDPVQLEMAKTGEMYRIVSTYAAKVCEWTAGETAAIILREREKRGIPTPMALR